MTMAMHGTKFGLSRHAFGIIYALERVHTVCSYTSWSLNNLRLYLLVPNNLRKLTS